MPRGVFVRTEEYKEKHKRGINSFEFKEKHRKRLLENNPMKDSKSKQKHLESMNKPEVKAKTAYYGPNHPNWQGGISNFPYPFSFNKRLKEFIRNRDNYTCQLCGITQEENGRKLDVHHIDYDKDNLDPNNLIVLCRGCNSKVNFNRDFWKNHFINQWLLVA